MIQYYMCHPPSCAVVASLPQRWSKCFPGWLFVNDICFDGELRRFNPQLSVALGYVFVANFRFSQITHFHTCFNIQTDTLY